MPSLTYAQIVQYSDLFLKAHIVYVQYLFYVQQSVSKLHHSFNDQTNNMYIASMTRTRNSANFTISYEVTAQKVTTIHIIRTVG